MMESSRRTAEKNTRKQTPKLDFKVEQNAGDEQLYPLDFRLGSSKISTTCRVCGDAAHGMYFGAMVCIPCKTFFLRYGPDGSSDSAEEVFAHCKFDKGDCVINPNTRTRCKFCRFQKCLNVGMVRKVRPTSVIPADGVKLCAVCNDVSSGVHFGVVTCEGCKKFYRRGILEHAAYQCKLSNNCIINPRTRNGCRFCRFAKCTAIGMATNAIQMGRPSATKRRQSGTIRKTELTQKRYGVDQNDGDIHPKQTLLKVEPVD